MAPRAWTAAARPLPRVGGQGRCARWTPSPRRSRLGLSSRKWRPGATGCGGMRAGGGLRVQPEKPGSNWRRPGRTRGSRGSQLPDPSRRPAGAGDAATAQPGGARGLSSGTHVSTWVRQAQRYQWRWPPSRVQPCARPDGPRRSRPVHAGPGHRGWGRLHQRRRTRSWPNVRAPSKASRPA